MRAHRLGHVFSAEDGPSWMVSHAAYPAPILLEPDQLRVFIVARDENNRGSVGYVDLNPHEPRRVVGFSERPCLEPGEIGTFDDRGISIGSVHRIGGELWMYYMGWNKSADVPFRNAIGLAISRDGTGAHFERVSNGPLLDRSQFDHYTLSYPYVTPPDASSSSDWNMIYGTSRAGGVNEKNMHHVLTEAHSADGIDWHPKGGNFIGLEEGEYGLSRPWLWRHGDRPILLYSIRRASYRIGCSLRTGNDGAWRRESSDLLGPSAESWDSDAQCYPAVVNAGGSTLMFYNGNGYGKTGFGVGEFKL